MHPKLILATLVLWTGLSHAALTPPVMPSLIAEYQADDEGLSAAWRQPWSEAAFARSERMDQDWLGRLQKMDFEALVQADKVDWLLLRNRVRRDLAEIARARKHLAEMDDLLAFRGTIHRLESNRVNGIRLDAPTAATAVQELSTTVKELKERAERGQKPKDEKASEVKKDEKPAIPASPSLALRTSEAVDRLRNTLKNWYTYYDGFDPAASWWLKEPWTDADKQLEDYGKYLKETVAGQKGKDDDPLVGDPLGAELIAEDAGFEWMAYSARDMLAIAERELAWGEAEMKKAARKLGCGDDWHAAMTKVKADHVGPGEQDALVKQVGLEATAFARKHDFATIPPLAEEIWQITMMSPETLKSIPYAAYNGREVMVAYANQTMKQDDKLMVMRGNNKAFTHLTTMHELIPGHHLQNFVAARHNQHRQIFGTPFYIEGWALYCEFRFWDLGWARTPEERIGMLFWRMNRAARTIVSLKYHLGEMKPEEMVEFMMKRVGHEKFGATSEVRRIVRAQPLYQVGYLMGGRQLLALRQEAMAKNKWTEQQFNDAVLQANVMPIELLRALLLDQPLTRDAKPAWLFDAAKP